MAADGACENARMPLWRAHKPAPSKENDASVKEMKIAPKRNELESGRNDKESVMAPAAEKRENREATKWRRLALWRSIKSRYQSKGDSCIN